MKRLITLFAVAGLVLALAPAATVQAEPLVTDGLLGYWSFDAQDATDDSTNGHHGTESGTVAYRTDDVPTNGGAASLDLTASGSGSIGVITGGNEDIFDTEAHSIAFWTKGEPSGDWGNWITKSSEGDGFMIRQHTSAKTTMYYDIRGGGGDLSVSINHADNVWHHYVMTYDSSGVDSGTKRIYQDGAEVASAGGQDAPPSLRTLAFGDRDGNDAAGYQPIGGSSRTRVQFDEIYYFDRAITSDEVVTLITPPSPASGTLIYWK